MMLSIAALIDSIIKSCIVSFMASTQGDVCTSGNHDAQKNAIQNLSKKYSAISQIAPSATAKQKAKATVIKSWFCTHLLLNTDSMILYPINANENPYMK